MLVHIAETLAGITLVQCVNKGAPGICGSVGSTTDLRTMNHLGGPIERAMIHAAVSQMAQHFEIPLYSTGGTSDAKEVDIQASYESAMSNLLVAMSGANYIHDAAGLMDFALSVSLEKYVVDNEILGMVMRAVEGIRVNDESLAFDLIKEVGPAGHFVHAKHTRKNMRTEHYQPTLSDREHLADWQAQGKLDTAARAKAQVDEILSAPGYRLPDEVRQRILAEIPGIID